MNNAFANAIAFMPWPSTYDPALRQALWEDRTTGEFTSFDTFAGDDSNPITLNKYLYANSDPINVVDPSGHFGIADLEISMGLEGVLASIVLTGVAASYVFAQHSAAFIHAASAVTNEVQDLLASGVASLEAEATKLASNTAAVVVAIDAALLAAGAAAVTAWKASAPIPPIFPVIMSAGAAVYALDVAALATHPQWWVLTYNGPLSLTTLANRAQVRGFYGGIMATAPAGSSLDEFPYASTAQGGMLSATGPSVAGPVPWLQNAVQGGLLSAFYRFSLKGTAGRPFLVVPVPL